MSFVEINNFNENQNEENYIKLINFLNDNPIEIRKIKKDLLIKYPKLSIISISKNGFFMSYIPQEIITFELCLEASKTDGRFILFAPKDILEHNPSLYLKAIEKSPYLISFIPDEVKESNVEICKISAKKFKNALLYIPLKIKEENHEIYNLAIDCDLKNLTKSSFNFLSKNIDKVKKITLDNPELINDLPEKFLKEFSYINNQKYS